MKRFLLFLLIFTSQFLAQYQPKSGYLQNSDKLIGYVDSCAAFWTNVYDNSYGGFFTNVSRTGSRYNDDKNMLSQSRNVYGLTRAYMMTGKEEYLNLADEAIKWMYEKAWDKNNGGWFSSMSRTGSPRGTTNPKSAFDQHYALLGIRAIYETTNDPEHYEWLEKAYQQNENLWDNDENNFGYYDAVSYDWKGKSGKSFNATVDALTTHLMHMYMMFGEQKYLDRIEEVCANIQSHLVGSMADQQIGFAEEYSSQWNVISGETMTIMGHVLKTGWCLGRAYHFIENDSYLTDAKLLVDEVLEKGYDHKNGGPYKDYNRVTGQMLMWGNPDTAKAWWQMEQAVNAGLELYYLTKEDKYLKMADETLDFFMKHFVDHTYGDVYENRTKYGTETWGTTKGGGGKAGYHSIELGYLTYLYNNLYIKKKPTKLYYRFKELDEERVVKLTPLEFGFESLIIESIVLNRTEYSNFNSENREITIPSNTEAICEVVFNVSDETSNELVDAEIPDQFELKQNYPNPFNPETIIEFSIPIEKGHSTSVQLKIFDILGNEISTLMNEYKIAGTYRVKFDGTNLSSGVYFYSLKTGNYSKVKRMMLIK